MIASAKNFAGFLALVLLCTTGCQPNGTADHSKDRASYTAARHRQLGSNIPPPDSADTVNTKYDPDSSVGNTRSGLSTAGGAGGGR